MSSPNTEVFRWGQSPSLLRETEDDVESIVSLELQQILSAVEEESK